MNNELVFLKTVSIGDLLTIISLVFIVIGGIFTLYQWHKEILLKRASYINELTEKIRTDPYISEMVYLLDYSSSWYSSDFHESGDFELKIDKTLSYFSYICYLKKQNIITKREFKFFKYEIDRILLNSDLQDYFYNLYHFSAKFNVPFTFYYLFVYGKKHHFFDKDFFDKTAHLRNHKYSHNLNF